jgi:hypothetical protein
MKTRKSFNINGEMLGKASRFVCNVENIDVYTEPNLNFLRIEKCNFFGAKIIACDGYKLIIFIDPASDFKGPDINLEVCIPGRNPSSIILSPFIKACRKLRSEVKSKKGYVTIDPARKEAGTNGEVFNIICNSEEYWDYKKDIGKVKRIVNKKNVAAISSNYFDDSRHAILSEEKQFHHLHFINVSHGKGSSAFPAAFLLITSYSILLIMPMGRGNLADRELDSDSKILVSKKSLLEKVNLMLSLEDENPFTEAYKKKEFSTEFGNIFFDIE